MTRKENITLIEILLGVALLSLLLAVFVLYFNFAKIRAATSQAWAKEQVYNLCDLTADLITNSEDLTINQTLKDKLNEIDKQSMDKDISKGTRFVVEADRAIYEYVYSTPSSKYDCIIRCSTVDNAIKEGEPAGAIVLDDNDNNLNRLCVID